MIAPLMIAIRDQFLSLNPQTFTKGFADARQVQSGRVIVNENGQEMEYAGLSDLNCNFFYVRYGDAAIGFEPVTENRLTSCPNYAINGPVRIVEWVVNGDQTRMVEVTINDLLANINLGDISGFDRVEQIQIEQAVLSQEEIFKEETLLDEERVRLQKGVTLIAVDFIIPFINKVETLTSCLDRSMCVEQC